MQIRARIPFLSLLIAFPGVAGAQGSDQTATILRLEREYARATLQRDTTVLRRLEPPDATFTYPDGSTGNGTTDLQAVFEGKVRMQEFRLDSLKVRMLEPTVAVVTGRATVKGAYHESPQATPVDLSGEFRLTDVWHQRSGHWQLAAEQYTRIKTGP